MNTLSPLHILALMDLNERVALHQIASKLLPKSVIVEVGTFIGGSAAIMAHASPEAEIHCIDLFEDDPYKLYRGPAQYKHFDRILGKESSERSKNNVAEIIKDYKNITLHKGRSPDAFLGKWDLKIDLFFEDSLHRNPSLSNNLKFWTPFIKKGGYLLMHDYRPFLPLDHYHRFPDVEFEYENLLKNGYKSVDVVGGLAILQKI